MLGTLNNMLTAALQGPSARHHGPLVDELADSGVEICDEVNGNNDRVARSDGDDDEEQQRWEDEREAAMATELDIGVLLTAMDKCVAFYHQANKIEFYAMVAEEYGAMLPDRDEVSVEEIEETETVLQQIAMELMASTDDSSDVDLPRDVEPHVEALLAFYRALGSFDASEDASEEEKDEEAAPPHEPTQSPAGHTDGSASNPTTPLDERVEERVAISGTAEDGASRQTAQASDHQPPPPSTELTAMAPVATTTSATSPYISQATYGHAKGTLLDLTKAHVESKQRLSEQEELLKIEKLRTQQKKREYKALKAIVKQYRQRNEERKRIRLLLDDGSDVSDGSSEDGERLSLPEMRKLYRKEQKKLRRLQENLSLKFQLLQSEDKRHRMEIEQQMAQLRNEYTDSYVFGP